MCLAEAHLQRTRAAAVGAPRELAAARVRAEGTARGGVRGGGRQASCARHAAVAEPLVEHHLARAAAREDEERRARLRVRDHCERHAESLRE